MSLMLKTHETHLNCQILSHLSDLRVSSRLNLISPNQQKNPTKNHNMKNKPKLKTMPTSMTSKIQKIAKFESLIHSNVSETTKKSFILELYKGVKYSLKSLKTPHQSAIAQKRIRLDEPEQSKQKMLFLDLDQTLIFTEIKSAIDIDSKHIAFKMHIRPYTKKFLSNVSKFYNIYIFTAGTKEYAEAVINKLNSQKKLIQDYLCRDHCFYTRRGKVIKDLRIIQNRTLNDIILVDNKPESFGLQIDNGIPILQFHGSKYDTELINLQKILIQLSAQDDVRKGIQDHFKLRNFAELSKEELQAYLNCGKSFGNSEKFIEFSSNV